MAKYTTIANINGRPTEIGHEELYIVQRLDGRSHAFKKHMDAVHSMWSDYMAALQNAAVLDKMLAQELVNDWVNLNTRGHIDDFGDILVAEVIETEDRLNG